MDIKKLYETQMKIDKKRNQDKLAIALEALQMMSEPAHWDYQRICKDTLKKIKALDNDK